MLRIILKNSALYIVYAGRVNGGCRSDAINGQQLLPVEFCWAEKIKKSDFSPHNLGTHHREEIGEVFPKTKWKFVMEGEGGLKFH